MALQYYFYWYFNLWNDLHESDWEGIQILFDAPTAAEALTIEPSSTAYAQYYGGETAQWGDPKIQLDGTRPFVYSSAGSHASYYESAVFLGRGPSTGFGCDDTSGPSRRVDPEVVLLPTDVADATGDLAWVAFEGHWGQRGLASYDSPTGPVMKDRWDDPIGWQETLRDGSITVPGSGSAAQIVDAFCSAVGWGSSQFIRFQISPWTVLTPVGVLVLLGAAILRRTSWNAVAVTPVAAPRTNGEILRASVRAIREHPRRLLAPVLVLVPAAGILATAVHALRALPIADDLIELINHRDATGLTRIIGALVTGSPGLVLVSALMTAAVSVRLDELERSEPSGLVGTLDAIRSRVIPMMVTLTMAVVAIAVAAAVLFTLPLVLWWFVRWSLVPVVVMREGLTGIAALRRSSRLVKSRAWGVGAVVITTQATALVGGLVFGLIVLTVATALPLWAMTGLVAGFGAVIMPVVAVCIVLLYGRARSQEALTAAAEPAGVVSER